MGCGCGLVGSAVASDTRGPQFQSSHWQNLYLMFSVNCIKKTKIKNKEAENGPFFKKADKNMTSKANLINALQS